MLIVGFLYTQCWSHGFEFEGLGFLESRAVRVVPGGYYPWVLQSLKAFRESAAFGSYTRSFWGTFEAFQKQESLFQGLYAGMGRTRLTGA